MIKMNKRSKSTPKVPNLRFPGFEDEWERKRLGNLCSKIGSGKTPKGGENVYQKTGIPFIRSQNVNNNSLILDETHIPYDIHLSMKGSMVLSNDILLNITGASIGRSCVVPSDFNEGNVNQHVSIIRLKKYNPYFLQSVLSSWIGQKLIFQEQTGSGREGLNFESIKNFKIYFPQIEEQKKIASFLSLIDERIQTQSKIIKHLESLMRGLTQKLFNGISEFKDKNQNNFSNWNSKKLDEILKIGSGKDYKNLRKGNIPVYGTGGLMTYVNNFLYDGESVGIGRKGTIDKPIYLKGKFWTVDTLFYTHSFKGVRPKFVYYLFLQIKWKKYNEASGVPSLSKSTLEKIKVKIPSLEEQTKISKILSSLDKKIEKEKLILGQYQKQKKYLLQNVFI